VLTKRSADRSLTSKVELFRSNMLCPGTWSPPPPSFVHQACCLLPVAYCLLPIVPAACCLLPVACFAYCLLPIACCLLPVACCLLHVAYCLLPAACCLLPVACCLLPVAYCLLPAACCMLHTPNPRVPSPLPATCVYVYPATTYPPTDRHPRPHTHTKKKKKKKRKKEPTR
jgi:hypothetical protein